MRSIKLRAWHPEWDGMVYSDKVDCFEKRDYYPFMFAIGFSHYPKDERWEIMQWTGLTDKNGKEIYEGDMDKSGNAIMWSEKHALFCEHHYQEYFKKWVEASYPMDNSRVEIVGNIYEHPHLMNKEQKDERSVANEDAQ